MKRLLCVLLLMMVSSGLRAELSILPYEDRPIVENRIVSERLDTLLPKLMEESGIDFWLVIAREYNDDPVFLSLVPKPRFTARRTTMLVFHNRGEEGVDRFTVSRYPLGSLYEAAWEGGRSRCAVATSRRSHQRTRS